jgi:hypothetical protein
MVVERFIVTIEARLKGRPKERQSRDEPGQMCSNAWPANR